MLEGMDAGAIAKEVAAQHTRENAAAAVAGEREVLELPGRSIETVFYAAETSNAPIMFGFHGGGFVLGGHAINDLIWDTFCKMFNINVVSVNYRKGENNPFPNALDDADEVIQYYLHESPHSFDRSRVAVMGSSAGATLSAGTCVRYAQRGEDTIGLQILCYPVIDNDTPPLEKAKDPAAVENTVEMQMNYYFQKAYLPNPATRKDPQASPLFAPEEVLKKQPKALVIVAEYDDLALEALAYADKLEKAGVSVTSYTAKGMFHGFFEFAFESGNVGYSPEMLNAAKANGSLEQEKQTCMKLMEQAFKSWQAN